MSMHTSQMYTAYIRNADTGVQTTCRFPLGDCEPRAAFNSTHFTVRMAPVTGAEKAALDAFFKGKRGERALIEHPPARGLGISSVWPEAPFALAWTG